MYYCRDKDRNLIFLGVIVPLYYKLYYPRGVWGGEGGGEGGGGGMGGGEGGGVDRDRGGGGVF